MQIVIKMMVTGKTITLDVEASKTIGDVKAEICNFEGIPANQQRLLFNGSSMVFNNHKLSEYHIQNESTLQLLICDNCCRGCENKPPMDFTPVSSACCFPNSHDMDTFNLCSKKLETLLFCIFQVDHLVNKTGGDGFWWNPVKLTTIGEPWR